MILTVACFLLNQCHYLYKARFILKKNRHPNSELCLHLLLLKIKRRNVDAIKDKLFQGVTLYATLVAQPPGISWLGMI